MTAKSKKRKLAPVFPAFPIPSADGTMGMATSPLSQTQFGTGYPVGSDSSTGAC